MALKPSWEEEKDLTSHLSYLTGQTLSELLNGAHLYAMKCRTRYLARESIKMDLNMWYNCLKEIYIATINLLMSYEEEKAHIDECEEEYLEYLVDMDTRPELRKNKLHVRILEQKCMKSLSDMQVEITKTMQKYYMFFRFEESKVRNIGLPQSSEDMIKMLEQRGVMKDGHVIKEDFKHDRLHKKRTKS